MIEGAGGADVSLTLFYGFSEGTTKMMLFQYYEQNFGRFRSGIRTADTETRTKNNDQNITV